MKLYVLVSDLQIPFQHKRSLGAFCGFLADRAGDIEQVHQVGDFFDFEALSRFAKGTDLEDGRRLQRELAVGRGVMADILAAYPGPKTRILGNHDRRLGSYLSSQAKGLRGLGALGYDELTSGREYGWETYGEPFTVVKGVRSVHGLTVRQKAGYTAHAHIERVDFNVIHGHTHRLGLVYRTRGDTTQFGFEVGCLMDRAQASYLAAGLADWQLGFGALWSDGVNHHPVPVYIKPDGSFVFEGRRYR